MRLLVVTQALDTADPVLGFFDAWVRRLSERVPIAVFALRVGAHTLPTGTIVERIRAEGPRSRLRDAARFLALSVRHRRSYDTVLVHMNPEYVVLAGIFWKLMGKRVALWYNHPKRHMLLQIALLFADRVFYTSPQAATAGAIAGMRMPVGIDTELFAPGSKKRDPHLIYLQGRVSEGKRIHVALAALRALRAAKVPARLAIVGPADDVYLTRLREEFAPEFAEGAADYFGPAKNTDTPELFAHAAVALNLAREGHFDKTALEAASCETPVVVGSRTFAGLIPDPWIVRGDDPAAVSHALLRFFALSARERTALGKTLRERVVATHSLPTLIDRLVASLEDL